MRDVAWEFSGDLDPDELINVAWEFSGDLDPDELIRQEEYRRDRMAMISGRMSKENFKKKWLAYIESKKKKKK